MAPKHLEAGPWNIREARANIVHMEIAQIATVMVA